MFQIGFNHIEVDVNKKNYNKYMLDLPYCLVDRASMNHCNTQKSYYIEILFHSI